MDVGSGQGMCYDISLRLPVTLKVTSGKLPGFSSFKLTNK